MPYDWRIRHILFQVEESSKPLTVIPFKNQGLAALHHFDLTTDARSFLAELGILSPSAMETAIDGLEGANPT